MNADEELIEQQQAKIERIEQHSRDLQKRLSILRYPSDIELQNALTHIKMTIPDACRKSFDLVAAALARREIEWREGVALYLDADGYTLTDKQPSMGGE